MIDKSNDCLNCNCKIAKDAVYCSACGQKHFDGKISLKDLFRDFFDNFLNLDFSIFRTIKALFIPGKLTIEYFSGKHKTYANPFRIFLIALVLLLALTTLETGGKDVINVSINIKEELQNLKYKTKLDSAITIIENKFDDNKNIAIALDSLQKMFLPDSIFMADSFSIQLSNFATTDTVIISSLDLYRLSFDELKEKYNIETEYWQGVVLNQILQVFQKEGSLNNIISYFTEKLNYLLIILMPLIALIYKLVYIRQKRFYIEHLVFNLHVHSFAFILFVVVSVFGRFVPGGIVTILMLSLVVYYIFALKNYYNQSWGKTIGKTAIIGFLYSIIVGISLAAYAVIGLVII